MKQWIGWLTTKANDWLTREGPAPDIPLCDFARLRFELRPGDVILIEGRSRVSEVIKLITQSSWSHAALYVGRLFDVRDPKLRAIIETNFTGDPEDQLIVEALMGRGTIIEPLSKYRREHLRICRPDGLAPDDAQKVIGHALRGIGLAYDMRQILDLARFFFPWAILPRRWRSSLFQHNVGTPTRTVCSTLLAEAYNAVDFPILPFIDRGSDGSLRFFKRNPRLFSPRDFDYSPYFDIIKYPFLGVNDIGLYRKLPWGTEEEFVYNDEPLKRVNTPSDDAPTVATPHNEPETREDFAVTLKDSVAETDIDQELSIGAIEIVEQNDTPRRQSVVANFPFFRQRGS